MLITDKALVPVVYTATTVHSTVYIRLMIFIHEIIVCLRSTVHGGKHKTGLVSVRAFICSVCPVFFSSVNAVMISQQRPDTANVRFDPSVRKPVYLLNSERRCMQSSDS